MTRQKTHREQKKETRRSKLHKVTVWESLAYCYVIPLMILGIFVGLIFAPIAIGFEAGTDLLEALREKLQEKTDARERLAAPLPPCDDDVDRQGR